MMTPLTNKFFGQPPLYLNIFVYTVLQKKNSLNGECFQEYIHACSILGDFCYYSLSYNIFYTWRTEGIKKNNVWHNYKTVSLMKTSYKWLKNIWYRNEESMAIMYLVDIIHVDIVRSGSLIIITDLTLYNIIKTLKYTGLFNHHIKVILPW